MKPGDTCWIKTVYQGVEDSPSDGYPCTVYYGMPADGDVLPDSPMLPAVSRWLASLPEWIDAAELATALESVLLSSKEQQAAVFYEAVPRGYERHNEFMAAGEAIQPHGWEALESLIATLTEENTDAPK